jgi:hypothetical protein
VEPPADVDDKMVLEYETLLFEVANSLRDLLEVEKEMTRWAMPWTDTKASV